MLGFSSGRAARSPRLGGDCLVIQSPAVVLNRDDQRVPFPAGFEGDPSGCGFAREACRSADVSMPWPTALRTTCKSGSKALSRTARSRPGFLADEHHLNVPTLDPGRVVGHSCEPLEEAANTHDADPLELVPELQRQPAQSIAMIGQWQRRRLGRLGQHCQVVGQLA